jgi:prepilin-type N-terminal cleavage/methylation domain-containing protein
VRRDNKGFSILELLIAVGIIGILAAIAIWNYFTAIQRGKQRRTMADIRSIAVAWETRAIDAKSYNGAGFTFPGVMLTSVDVNTMLVPTYIKFIPTKDGWGNDLEFAVDQSVGSSTPAKEYSIRSGGRDGKFSGSIYGAATTTNFDCDIVYSNGTFVVYPEGTQLGN